MRELMRPLISDLPIDVDRGTTQTPEFVVKSKGRYLVTASIKNNPGMPDRGCLLGVWLDARDCETITPQAMFSWSLFTNGRLSHQGQSFPNGFGRWTGQRVENTFGEFVAIPGEKYALHITSLPGSAVLAPADPQISVHLGPGEFKERWVDASLRAYASMAIAALAIMLLLAMEVAKSVIRRSAPTAIVEDTR